MNITRSKISLTYIIITISLLALVSISSFIASRNTEAKLNSIVNDIIPLSNLAQELSITLVNMESGLRGYEVTREAQYLQPYDESKAKLNEHLLAMDKYQKQYTRLNNVMAGEVIPQIQRLQDHYSSQINLIGNGQMDTALERVAIGKNLMDRYRQIHTKLTSEIEEIASDTYDSARSAETTARVIITLGGSLALIIGLFSVFTFIRAKRAEAALRRSEESYRFLAESLEAQNEEIITQQDEQEAIMVQLSQREHELEAITNYQEKLTGSTDMEEFLQSSVPALLESLQLDAAMLVMKSPETEGEEAAYEVLYSIGYPSKLQLLRENELFGPALRVLTEKQPLDSTRNTTEQERGFHQGLAYAVDRYFPLFNDQQEAVGFLLITGYVTEQSDLKARLTKGLIRQFGLAFLAQQINEERRRQSVRLEQQSEQLQQEKGLIEEQHHLIENILESTHEGMMMCDSEGQWMFANHRMDDFFPFNRQSGTPVTAIFQTILETSSDFSSVFKSIQGLLRGEVDRLTERFSFVGPDNQQRHLNLYATKVGDNRQEEQGFLFVFRDRTEEERADEIKNEFISIVSHELRTPLSSVLGFIEILLHRQLSPEKQQRYLQTIYKEAMRLSTLINDFLDLQRMESGKQIYHFAPVELRNLLQEVAEQWRGKQSHQIMLHLPDHEVWVRADADRLKQVGHNLMSNAIKYSPHSEQIDLTLRLEGRHVLILIQDYGLGIPEEAKDKLFTRFYRVDNSDRRQIGGTGLGLAIVREIVEAHQGTISFESAMGQGTTFAVELMTYEIQSAEGSIMILEDDDNLARLIGVALSKLQVPMVYVRSAEEAIIALHQIREHAPLLCIVDIHLEGSMNGWDFIAELYRHPKYYRTPVIVSTALEQPQDYHEKDIEKFLRKPFSMEKLLQVADHLLKHTNGQPAYIFPAQDEELIKNTLAIKGIEVEEITRQSDHIQIEPKTAHKTEVEE
ncbi:MULTISPECIES: ATP-binding protein [unclassified Paenibacillus]|uniref:ATP-binding protein n=1 Tax=unclassified Paenibacillus TaxID=185978 RepID=UPI001AE55204|nr:MULTISPECIES: ATP-binding protein [unclassified Paenibacillus]MBP1153417.1 signal transduction histidine kinase/CHASE3 domain sensor protein/DNA-binding response OmpR family regulator [Paenibacillus sp. PvP091]MBP1171200.1 signal transduction histidine kinase/CHASE3 domain sensor protein/DNA-binding response OmpR family regulator [Paenibacillus sp. PvR098]MBP2442228.1 signal transduction histidine kinase/CHASE3 domain sensor protein/DNA-binding response OmpR family regulator [Paenibacillus sp